MSFEPSVTGIFSLDPAVPAANTRVEYGDDNLRNIKTALRWQFAGFAGDAAQVTVSPTVLNYLSGVTSSVQTQLDSKLASADLTQAAINALDVDAATLNGESAYALLAAADFTALQVGGAAVATEDYVDAATAAAVSASGWLDVLDPIASGANISSSGDIAHGLGQVPDNVILRLVCKGASGGYSENDIVMLQTSDASNLATEVGSTNLIVRMWNLMYIPYGDGTNNLFDCRSDNTNWKLQANAVVY